MSDASNLRIETVSHGSILYVRLFGPIDETFDVDEILAAGRGKDLLINTAAVHRISSFGVREWVNGIAKLASVKNRIILVDCSPVLVKQLNMVSNFAEHLDVVSIQAPYYCSACGWDTEVVLKVGPKGVDQRAEPVVCKRCRSQMEFDEDPSFYFRFARPNRFRPLDPHLIEFLANFERAAAQAAVDERLAREQADEIAERPTDRVKRQRRRQIPISWLAAGGAGAVLLILLLVVSLSSGGGGIPPEALQRYHSLLGQSDFANAEALVQELEKAGDVPPDLAATMKKEISDKRDAARDEALTQARRYFGRKQYQAALEHYQAAEKIGGATPSINFTQAECYRRLGNSERAVERYQKFVNDLGDKQNDRRLDDALYWLADSLVKNDEIDKAKPLLRRIIKEMPKSNFKRSAVRLLDSID